MKTIKDLYMESIKDNHYGLNLLIQFLVYEKKVVKLDDDISKLDFYLQDRFTDKMNAYLRSYENQINEKKSKIG